jgi:putative DNA primase/helicase
MGSSSAPLLATIRSLAAIMCAANWVCLRLSPARKKNGGGAPWKLISEHIYKDESDAPYLRVRKCIDDHGKKQYPQSRWDGAGWVKGKPDGSKIPYRLPQLIAAPAITLVYVVEGEKCADALARLGFVATTNSEGAGKWTADLNKHFKGRHVVIVGDNDQPGRRHVQHVARNLHGVAATVQTLELARHWLGEPMPVGDDVADYDRAGSRLAQLAKDAPLWEPVAELDSGGGSSDEALIVELAALSALDYARRRKEAAKALGIGAGDLDRIVRRTRGAREDEDKAPPAPCLLYEHWDVEAAADEVDGDILLRALVETLRRYVVMDGPQAIACALWVIMTWVHEKAVVHSPILLVNSPLPGSGKTTLLRVISFLARNGLSSVSITGPALFRSIEKWAPTIAIDEADTAFVNNADIKDVVNSGWTRGDCIIRCDPDTHDPRSYPTFCPKAIGMIGRKLPSATVTRCLMIPMRRKRPDEHADDFDHVDDANLARLRSQLLRWATDNAEALATARPEIPPGLHNRVRMNWWTLLAIAECCNSKRGAWEAVKAVEEVNATADLELAAELLSDIRDAFDRRNADRLTTKDLLAELTGDAEGPWLSYGKGGKPITDRQLGRLLKDFRRGKGIRSKNVRVESMAGVAKGYERFDFEEDFAAYLAYPRAGFSSRPPEHRYKPVFSIA